MTIDLFIFYSFCARHLLVIMFISSPLPLSPTDLMWTAPELLRDSDAPPGGTQKGDVYSFALTLYEVYSRSGPFGDIELTPRGEWRKATKYYIEKDSVVLWTFVMYKSS